MGHINLGINTPVTVIPLLKGCNVAKARALKSFIFALACTSCGAKHDVKMGPSLPSPDGKNIITLGYNIPGGTLEGEIWVMIHPVKDKPELKHVRTMLRRCDDVSIHWSSNGVAALEYSDVELYLFESYSNFETKLELNKLSFPSKDDIKAIKIKNCSDYL
jgi:hypothetical protein